MFQNVTLKVGEILRIRLKERREKLNLTQEDVAKASGIKRAYYTMIENGKRTPSVEEQRKLHRL